MDDDELTKKYKRHCANCNTKFSIIYDEDKTEQRVTVCPFCSYELEDELDEQEEEVNENEDEPASWD
jgi:DNA-directed RNA polymerase subunit RPC12/RpoP